MQKLIFILYEFVASFIPFLIAFVFLKKSHEKMGYDISKKYYYLIVIFAFYIIAVFHFTGSGTIYNGFTYKLNLNKDQINLIPFSRHIDIVSYILNIVMLIPFGFFVSLIFEKKDRFFSVFVSGFLFSFLIEISQLLNNRRTDVDDLILNSLGAVLGYFIYKILYKKIKFFKDDEKIPGIDLFIYVFAMFSGRFLLFYEIGLAKLMYGF